MTPIANTHATGAVIVREPEDQFYGDRTYSPMDPQGHVWTFGQTIRHVTREDVLSEPSRDERRSRMTTICE